MIWVPEEEEVKDSTQPLCVSALLRLWGMCCASTSVGGAADLYRDDGAEKRTKAPMLATILATWPLLAKLDL